MPRVEGSHIAFAPECKSHLTLLQSAGILPMSSATDIVTNTVERNRHCYQHADESITCHLSPSSLLESPSLCDAEVRIPVQSNPIPSGHPPEGFLFGDQQSAVSLRVSIIMKDFRDLQVWRKAHALTLRVYRVTQTFPKEELYSLTSQLRRSMMSIPSNIAEGCGRSGDAELARFLQIALGSASEAEYQLLLARDLDYLTENTADDLMTSIQEVKRMISGLLRRLRNPDN